MPSDRPTVRVGRILASPGPAIRTSAFEPYVAAVGRLNYAWNNLHETLSKLFVAIASPTLPNIILSVWHSTRSDRGQRDMLLAALVASPEDRWSPRLPGPRNALIWLVQRVDELAESRNDAVHTPCSVYASQDGEAEVAAAFFSANPRARKLTGKKLIDEFLWCEEYCEVLDIFASEALAALIDERRPWPDTPDLPTRGRKRSLEDPHCLARTTLHFPPPPACSQSPQRQRRVPSRNRVR